MDSIGITARYDVPWSRVEDILCSVWETSPSVLEWAECSGSVRPPKGAKQDYRWQWPLYGGALFFKDIEADKGETYELNLQKVVKGLETMAEKYPAHFRDFLTENDDSITADVFLQCALFGEVKYS